MEDLFATVRCRRIAVELGFEKMTLKNETLRCYFINNPDSPYFESATFNHILQFIQTSLNKARLKQTGKLFMLVIEDVKSMETLLQLLQRISTAVKEKEMIAKA